MIRLTLDEIAGIVGGRVEDARDPRSRSAALPSWTAATPEPGGLFVAFAGEHVDGHDYARAAVEGGAAAVLGTRPTGVPTVLVDDAQAALQELARVVLVRRREMRSPADRRRRHGFAGQDHRQGHAGPACWPTAAPTVATAGSFNNELGLPLTVLRVEEAHRYLVLEMGARGVGHLTELCAIAPPDVSLVLNVGKAHIGEFGSQEQIAVAKGELVEALRPDGSAVLNLDDPLVAAMATRTEAHVWTFGRVGRRRGAARRRRGRRPRSALLRADLPAARPRRSRCTCWGSTRRLNAAATTATALAAGLPLDRIAASLRAIDHLSKWRMELHERADGLVVVNDAYNANPDSMRAALETLARMGRAPGRRTVAVLGEMRELGADAEEEHRQVGLLADRLGIDVVVVVGSGREGRVRRARRGPWRGPDDAPRRDHHAGRRLVARECGGPRRRARQGVAGRATRAGCRHAHRDRRHRTGTRRAATERSP